MTQNKSGARYFAIFRADGPFSSSLSFAAGDPLTHRDVDVVSPVVAVFKSSITPGTDALVYPENMPAEDGGPPWTRERKYTAIQIFEGECSEVEVVWTAKDD